MKASRLVATAMIAAGATVVTATTASAQPSAPADPAAPIQVAHGTDHGVGYTISDSRRSSTMTATIDSGRFVMADHGRGVGVTNRDGKTIAILPTALWVHNRLYDVASEIAPTGKTVVLKPVDAFERDQTHPSPAELAGAIVCGIAGGFAGLMVGLIAGALIGLLFLIVGAIPGAFIGAFLGAFFGAGIGVRVCFNLGGSIS